MTARWCGWKGNGVPDDDSVVADQDLLDQQSNHALTLDYVESFGRRAQAGEKRGQRFSETQIGGAVGGLPCDRLELGAGRVLAPTQLGHAVAQRVERQKVFLVGGEQTLDALLQTGEIAPMSGRAHSRSWHRIPGPAPRWARPYGAGRASCWLPEAAGRGRRSAHR